MMFLPVGIEPSYRRNNTFILILRMLTFVNYFMNQGRQCDTIHSKVNSKARLMFEIPFRGKLWYFVLCLQQLTL